MKALVILADLEKKVSTLSIRVILLSTALLISLLIISSLFANKKHKHLKTPLFIMIVLTIMVGSLTLLGSTIYLNTKSSSKGPVHWHADIEFWVCDTQLEIRNPSGFLSNKIGTSTLHEHNDQRIHLEGVVVDGAVDASLGKFMRVIGGSISNSGLVLPIEDGIIEDFIDGDNTAVGGASNVEKFISLDSSGKKILAVQNDMKCLDGEMGKLQTFVYSYNKENKTYTQKKIINPEEYVIRDESIVPPGDCIVVEFQKPRVKTDRLCEQYGVRDTKRCTQFGVKVYNPELCNIKETESNSEGQ